MDARCEKESKMTMVDRNNYRKVWQGTGWYTFHERAAWCDYYSAEERADALSPLAVWVGSEADFVDQITDTPGCATDVEYHGDDRFPDAALDVDITSVSVDDWDEWAGMMDDLL